MKTTNIGETKTVNINEDGKFFFTGDNDEVSLTIKENVNAKILFFNTNITNLKFLSKKNSNVDLTFVSIEEKKNANTFELQEHANINVRVVSTKKIFEKSEICLSEPMASFYGEYLIIAREFINQITTKVIHNAKKTFSKIENFGIAKQGGKINFETIGKIEQGQIKSHCEQITRGVILDDNTEISSQPILLIDEADVQAHHGVAIGKISDDELFYLLSRGLTQKESEKIIIDGIVQPLLEHIDDGNVKEKIKKEISCVL